MKNNFYANVFGWLFIGLLLTFGSAILTALSPSLLTFIFSSSGYIALVIAQLVLCVVLSVRIHKMSPIAAKLLYITYTILTGCTFASIFLLFQISSIIFVFLVTAVTFAIFAIIGKTTKIDLSKLGIYLFMSLLAIIILEIINIFIMNNTIDMLTCIVGVVIFFGYIAYDMQKIKQINDSETGNDNLAIIGAFELYLDFINLFIKLLRLFGKERD